jgi:ribosomal protein S18 acetylase RimI-like enzyme
MIEPYGHHDLKEIIEYQKELYGMNFKNMKYDYFFYVGIMNWYQQIDEQSDYASFVYKRKGKVEGFYLFHKVENQSAYLMQMFVSSFYRKKGVGKKLLTHFEEKAKKMGIKNLFLEVSAINQEVVNFYRKNGFVSIDEEYDENMDIRYFMQKSIS